MPEEPLTKDEVLDLYSRWVGARLALIAATSEDPFRAHVSNTQARRLAERRLRQVEKELVELGVLRVRE